jgi:hypothetical protein
VAAFGRSFGLVFVRVEVQFSSLSHAGPRCGAPVKSNGGQYAENTSTNTRIIVAIATIPF